MRDVFLNLKQSLQEIEMVIELLLMLNLKLEVGILNYSGRVVQ